LEEPLTVSPSLPINYSIFTSVKDNVPKPRKETWEDLAKAFSTHQLVAGTTKDARNDRVALFCPASFTEGAKRSAKNVQFVYLAVLDMDGGHDPSDFVDMWTKRGLEFLIYTTWQHSVESPRWRAIFPLENPVASEDWLKAWTGITNDLAQGLSDEACKDASRMYFVPCCSASDEAKHATEWHKGKYLDATPYIELADVAQHQVQQEQSARTSGRVGDNFEEQMSIDQILSPAGWTRGGKAGGLDVWIRPGKDDKKAISATWGYRTAIGAERLYVFSSSTNLPQGQALSKFSVYSYLNHGGDFKAAARALTKEGYAQLQVVTRSETKDTGVSVGTEVDPETSAREFTDAANGERLVKLFGSEFRYVAELKSWAVWDGCKWSISATAESKIRGYAIESARSLQREAGICPDPDRAKKMFTFAIRSQDTARIDACIKEAKAKSTVSILDFDKHPWLLNCKNGIVDLKTGKLLPHDRDLLMSQSTGCDFYTENTRAPVFESFIKKIIPDDDTAEFLVRYIGYSLTGSTKEQSYVFLHGNTGNNGKSTLINILQHIFGDYNVTLDTEAIMQTKGFVTNPDYELARLKGKRFAAVNEVSDSQKLNEPLIKRLTGGDYVKGRQIYGMPFDFPAIAKIFMTGNNKPAIYGQDNATWRRVNLVPFDVEVPKEERDTDLIDKLIEESPRILRVLVGMCLKWQKEGAKKSALMLDEKEEYKEENDFMGTFIEEELKFYSGFAVNCTRLHQHYLEWARKNGCHPLNPTAFGRVMSHRLPMFGDVEKVRSNGKFWRGVGLSEEN